MSFSKITSAVLLTILLVSCTRASEEPATFSTYDPFISASGNTPIANSNPSIVTTSTLPATLTPSPTAFRREPNPFPEQGELSDQEFVHQLFQTNGGCKLPCWWGIIPGETQWDETERFLLDISLEIELSSEETTTEADGISSHHRVFHIYIDDDKNHRLGLWTSDNLVTGIRISSPLTDYHFLIKDLLENQGIPDKVFIFTHSNVMEPPTAFNLILYYQEQRFLAAYTTLVYKENEQITACLDDVGPDLIIFREKVYLSDQQIQEIFLGPDPLGVLSVNDAIGMSPTVFYETYRNSETSCLVTPANVWP